MNTNEEILKALAAIETALAEKNPLEARSQLLVACELVESLDTDAYDDVLVRAEGACTALETEIYGTDKQKLAFRTILIHESV